MTTLIVPNDAPRECPKDFPRNGGPLWDAYRILCRAIRASPYDVKDVDGGYSVKRYGGIVGWDPDDGIGRREWTATWKEFAATCSVDDVLDAIWELVNEIPLNLKCGVIADVEKISSKITRASD